MGGIPVVVIFGDDYQLSLVACNVATVVIIQVGEYKSLSNNKKEWTGMMQFLGLGESVIELDEVVPQSSHQKYYKSLLGPLRFGWAKSSGRERLNTLVLYEDTYYQSEIEDILNHSICLQDMLTGLPTMRKSWLKLHRTKIHWLLSHPKMNPLEVRTTFQQGT
jgi:hypothetical protein